MSLAEQYEENEQYEQAYEEYKKNLQKRPDDMSTMERLGHLAMMLNKKDEAAGYYAMILERDMTNTLCYEQLMDIYADTDRYKYYVYRGNLHSVEHKIEQAVNDFKKALMHTDKEQEIVITRYTLGNLYSQLGDSNKAIDEFLKTLEYDQSNEAVYMKLADLYAKEDMLGSAIDTLMRAKQHFDTDIINETLAQLYLRDNQPAKAKEYTKDEMFAIKCMLSAGEVDEANAKLNELENKYQNDAEFHALKAQYHFEKGEYEKALEHVEKYNTLFQNSPLTYQMRALIYENTGDEYNEHLNWGKYNLVRGNKDIAVNEFLQAFQLKDDDIELMNTLAVLLEETGDGNHAMEFWERISKIEPTNRKAWEKLADFRESIGDYRTEADYLESWLEIDKRNLLVIKRLAEVYDKLKNKPSAIEYYNKYLQLSGSGSEADAVRKRLSKLENSDTAASEDEGLIDKIMRFFTKEK